MSGEILLARDGDIATVTLSNPEKLNALGLGSWKRLGEVMRELDADKRLRCIVMRGAGDKAFAAGADISEFETTRRNAKSAKKYGAVLEATMGANARCRGEGTRRGQRLLGHRGLQDRRKGVSREAETGVQGKVIRSPRPLMRAASIQPYGTAEACRLFRPAVS